MPKKRGWFYRKFMCGHWYSGQIKADRKYTHIGGKRYVRRHYRECQKCGNKDYVD